MRTIFVVEDPGTPRFANADMVAAPSPSGRDVDRWGFFQRRSSQHRAYGSAKERSKPQAGVAADITT